MYTFTEALKASIRLSSGNSTYSVHTIDNMQVVIQDDAVVAAGSIYGVTSINILGSPSVYIHSDLLAAPEYVQRFVLYHELGHIRLGHVKAASSTKERVKRSISNMFTMSIRNPMSLFGVVHKDEAAADAYAVSCIGKEGAVRALTYIDQEVKKHRWMRGTSRELSLRIEQISKGGDAY